MSTRRVVITGASGFLGRVLCREFLEAGWEVRAGVRDEAGRHKVPRGCRPFSCDLPGGIDRRAFAGAEACVHAAYPMGETDRPRARRAAVGGTLAILHECRRAGARPLFVSSCSAHDHAESFYGRSKFHLEPEFLSAGGIVVRPGFLLGDGGLFLRLVQSVLRFPVVPMFDGGRQPVQTIPVELAACGVRLAIEQGRAGRLVLAESQPITMRRFFHLIALGAGVTRRQISVPSRPALGLLRLPEGIGMRLPVTSENLLGWRGAVFQPSRDHLAVLGLSVPPAGESVPGAARHCLR